MTLLSLATTAPAPAPAPTPYPVCTSHHTAAIILGQDQNAMKAFTIVDKRSPKDMAAALEKFCQRKKFVPVFEAYVLFLINLIRESQGLKRGGAKQSSIPPLLLALDYLNI
ncbi:unnamed protein product [Amaranthus hypochondriacus]